MIKGKNRHTDKEWIIERKSESLVSISNSDSTEHYMGDIKFKFIDTKIVQNSHYSFTVLRNSIKQIDSEYSHIKDIVHIEKRDSKTPCFRMEVQLSDDAITRTTIKIT